MKYKNDYFIYISSSSEKEEVEDGDVLSLFFVILCLNFKQA